MTDLPRQTPEFDSIFEHCLRDVVRGVRTIDDCLEQYPLFAEELKPALQIGLLTARLKSPEMPASSIDALETHLRQKMTATAKPKVVQGRFSPFARLAAMVAIVFLITLGSGAGAVAASANAVPGDFLYGLKRLWEAILLAFTPLTGQVDDLWLRISETRLDELEELAKRGQLTDSMLIDLYTSMAQAITLADLETRPALMDYLSDAQTRLTNIRLLSAGHDQLYADVFVLTTPLTRDDGSLIPPAASPPSLNLTIILTPTLSPTATYTMTPTEARDEISPTATDTPTDEATATPTHTPTPRVPATSTRTPTATDTPRATFTPSTTPTATWTPLPLPTLPGSTPVVQPTQPPSSNNPGIPTNTPNTNATVRFRETEQAVYMTQTAGPPPTDTP